MVSTSTVTLNLVAPNTPIIHEFAELVPLLLQLILSRFAVVCVLFIDEKEIVIDYAASGLTE